ncbi:hypothetical protein Pyn_03660 [Prunus yedoensis var. nudiflora]|uniref:Uncharacterized protein n=1 Tax=Prunus yedoensis var. nudiflora TaxID=2094558 RepID=A0A314UPN8_PRUYE|nr:hypothetical protein Pyn_03660 [Prunus yedoensis var. nudiflora]
MNIVRTLAALEIMKCFQCLANVDVLHSRSTTWLSEQQSFADPFFLYIVVSSNIVPSTQSLHHRCSKKL